MALGPYCKALGIDEDVLSGQKSLTCDVKSLTNGVVWEMRKHKINKKLSVKDMLDWLIKIFDFKCENDPALQNELNEKLEKLASLRNMLSKSPKNYKGEVERLMNWPFDLPSSMAVEPIPVFEPTVRANLGPKLLKVLKEKAGDDDDSIDMSGQSDDDDDQVKRRKAREEIVQLKKDISVARKTITTLNDRLNELSKRCKLLTDMSKFSISEHRRTESDICKLKGEWNSVITTWHDCIDRLNYVNSNKGNYLDVGYMVRRNKTKQGIFDELNLEYERAVEEFKHKVNSLVEKERRKKKPVSREYRQKSKTDRKRVRQESVETEDSKKICLSEEVIKQASTSIPVEEFLKSEKVEEFKGGKFSNALKAIYSELLSMPIPCANLQDVIYLVLTDLEEINTDKIQSQSFAGEIFMEARMLAMLQAYSDLIKKGKTSISNDSLTKFTLVDTNYKVTLPDESHLILGIRDLSCGSPDTSFNVLSDIFGDLMNAKAEGNQSVETVAKVMKLSVIDKDIMFKKIMEFIFFYKQQIFPKIKPCIEMLPDTHQSKVWVMNNFFTGLYFLFGLAELADVTILAWELMSQSTNIADGSKELGAHQILSKTIQHLYSFSEAVSSNDDDVSKEFIDFLKKEKKLDAMPFAPCKGNIFNTVFHNSAGLWFFYEANLLGDFIDKKTKKGKKQEKEIKDEQKKVEEKKNEEQKEAKSDDQEKMEITEEEKVAADQKEGTETPKQDDAVESKEQKEKMETNVDEEQKEKEEEEEEEESEVEKSDQDDEEFKNSLYFDIWNQKRCFAVARALGLIGRLVAVPIWTVLEDYDIHIGSRYSTVLKKIESWARDAGKFMKGVEYLFDDVPVSHDAVYVSLIKSNEPNDALTKELLELIFTAFVPYIRFFLYGNAKTVKSTLNEENMECEDSDAKSIHLEFGVFDRITKNIHSASTYTLDALMLYSKTRNGEWQDKLCSKTNLRIFELIQRNAGKQLKSLYKRKIKLNEIKDSTKGQKHDEFSKCQLIEKRYKLIDDLINWGGLWKSEKEVDERLKDMKENDRMKALKAQIKFRRHVLCEVSENGLLDLASEGECFNVTKLYENLKVILKNECLQTETDIFELASATDDETLKEKIYESCKSAVDVADTTEMSKNYTLKENFHWLLGKLIVHNLIKGDVRENLAGVCIARKKVNGVYFYFIRYKEKDSVYKFSEGKIAEDYKKNNLRIVEPTTRDIIGSKISRAFFKDDGDLEWHDCRVVDTISHGPEFVVEFDIYGSTVQVPESDIELPEVESLTFTSHLLEDYRTDRLRFL